MSHIMDHVKDVIRVIDDGDEDWWWGECNEKEGWFSTSFVEGLRVLEIIFQTIRSRQTKNKKTYFYFFN